eukprot:CAMPEP_0180823978 /NCGR_PEP_ID=MMETSP1038_2-20121128/72196_1 /TAXON_ID=632150 /ORGANISM="Azadinium spinosum, Strain 3D9" /LENGTH=52 /DNA_ID=CAMNT_0022866351 /DNA_START=110 /DNA_END=264 /DNA_ORIENTATION=-
MCSECARNWHLHEKDSSGRTTCPICRAAFDTITALPKHLLTAAPFKEVSGAT